MKTIHKTISAYNNAQKSEDKAICAVLKREIEKELKNAESKIWHGSPVWFLDGNPIVGYHKLKDRVRLLFWSGQSFKEKELQKEGSFKASEIGYTKKAEINLTDLRRWLKKSEKIQWDYKNIVKRKGKLIRIKTL